MYPYFHKLFSEIIANINEYWFSLKLLYNFNLNVGVIMQTNAFSWGSFISTCYNRFHAVELLLYALSCMRKGCHVQIVTPPSTTSCIVTWELWLHKKKSEVELLRHYRTSNSFSLKLLYRDSNVPHFILTTYYTECFNF